MVTGNQATDLEPPILLSFLQHLLSTYYVADEVSSWVTKTVSKTYLVGRIIIEQCDERYNNNTKDKSNKNIY